MGYKLPELGKWSINNQLNLKGGLNKKHFIGTSSKNYNIQKYDTDKFIELSPYKLRKANLKRSIKPILIILSVLLLSWVLLFFVGW